MSSHLNRCLIYVQSAWFPTSQGFDQASGVLAQLVQWSTVCQDAAPATSACSAASGLIRPHAAALHARVQGSGIPSSRQYHAGQWQHSGYQQHDCKYNSATPGFLQHQAYTLTERQQQLGWGPAWAASCCRARSVHNRFVHGCMYKCSTQCGRNMYCTVAGGYTGSRMAATIQASATRHAALHSKSHAGEKQTKAGSRCAQQQAWERQQVQQQQQQVQVLGQKQAQQQQAQLKKWCARPRRKGAAQSQLTWEERLQACATTSQLQSLIKLSTSDAGPRAGVQGLSPEQVQQAVQRAVELLSRQQQRTGASAVVEAASTAEQNKGPSHGTLLFIQQDLEKAAICWVEQQLALQQQAISSSAGEQQGGKGEEQPDLLVGHHAEQPVSNHPTIPSISALPGQSQLVLGAEMHQQYTQLVQAELAATQLHALRPLLGDTPRTTLPHLRNKLVASMQAANTAPSQQPAAYATIPHLFSKQRLLSLLQLLHGAAEAGVQDQRLWPAMGNLLLHVLPPVPATPLPSPRQSPLPHAHPHHLTPHQVLEVARVYAAVPCAHQPLFRALTVALLGPTYSRASATSASSGKQFAVSKLGKSDGGGTPLELLPAGELVGVLDAWARVGCHDQKLFAACIQEALTWLEHKTESSFLDLLTGSLRGRPQPHPLQPFSLHHLTQMASALLTHYATITDPQAQRLLAAINKEAAAQLLALLQQAHQSGRPVKRPSDHNPGHPMPSSPGGLARQHAQQVHQGTSTAALCDVCSLVWALHACGAASPLLLDSAAALLNTAQDLDTLPKQNLLQLLDVYMPQLDSTEANYSCFQLQKTQPSTHLQQLQHGQALHARLSNALQRNSHRLDAGEVATVAVRMAAAGYVDTTLSMTLCSRMLEWLSASTVHQTVSIKGRPGDTSTVGIKENPAGHNSTVHHTVGSRAWPCDGLCDAHMGALAGAEDVCSLVSWAALPILPAAASLIIACAATSFRHDPLLARLAHVLHVCSSGTSTAQHAKLLQVLPIEMVAGLAASYVHLGAYAPAIYGLAQAAGHKAVSRSSHFDEGTSHHSQHMGQLMTDGTLFDTADEQIRAANVFQRTRLSQSWAAELLWALLLMPHVPPLHPQGCVGCSPGLATATSPTQYTQPTQRSSGLRAATQQQQQQQQQNQAGQVVDEMLPLQLYHVASQMDIQDVFSPGVVLLAQAHMLLLAKLGRTFYRHATPANTLDSGNMLPLPQSPQEFINSLKYAWTEHQQATPGYKAAMQPSQARSRPDVGINWLVGAMTSRQLQQAVLAAFRHPPPTQQLGKEGAVGLAHRVWQQHQGQGLRSRAPRAVVLEIDGFPLQVDVAVEAGGHMMAVLCHGSDRCAVQVQLPQHTQAMTGNGHATSAAGESSATGSSGQTEEVVQEAASSHAQGTQQGTQHSMQGVQYGTWRLAAPTAAGVPGSGVGGNGNGGGGGGGGGGAPGVVLSGEAVWQEVLLQQLGWSVVRVPYWEWQGLGRPATPSTPAAPTSIERETVCYTRKRKPRVPLTPETASTRQQEAIDTASTATAVTSSRAAVTSHAMENKGGHDSIAGGAEVHGSSGTNPEASTKAILDQSASPEAPVGAQQDAEALYLWLKLGQHMQQCS